MNEICDPEFILWQNQGVKVRFRLLMSFFNLSIIFVISLGTFMAISKFKEYRSRLFADVLPIIGQRGLQALQCGAVQVTKEEAFVTMQHLERAAEMDIDDGVTTREMYCYCQTEMYNDFFKFNDIVFPDGKKHCQDWWNHFIQL